MSLLQGSVVKSCAGHDKNKYHIVISADDNYAFICDGKERKLETPKRKNIKHLYMTDAVIDITDITNKKLRRLLSEFASKVYNTKESGQNS